MIEGVLLLKTFLDVCEGGPKALAKSAAISTLPCSEVIETADMLADITGMDLSSNNESSDMYGDSDDSAPPSHSSNGTFRAGGRGSFRSGGRG